MKVLHFVNKMNRAGQETFIMNIYRVIDRKRIQFGFLCAERGVGDYDEEIRELCGRIHHIDINKKVGKLRHIDNFFIMYKAFIKYKQEYQIFHIHSYHAFDVFISVVAAQLAGFDKVIVHSHSTSAESHIMLHKIVRKVLKKMNVIKLACSQNAGKWMFEDSNFEIIKNGVNIEKYMYNQKVRELVRNSCGFKPTDYIIGHIGRFDDVKNQIFLVKLLLEYCKENPNAKLLLVGDGVTRKSIEEYCIKNGIENKVIFTGVRADGDDLYQAMDLFVFPSKYEGLGIVAIEAQVSGLPCLVSDAVPQDIDISPLVTHCALNAPMSEWITIINKYQKMKNGRTGHEKDIRDAGYDINESALKLVKLYLS